MYDDCTIIWDLEVVLKLVLVVNRTTLVEWMVIFAVLYRNKHIMIDLGTGNNNKINWPMEDKQEMIDIVETVYRGARKGRGLVVSPKDYSTKYRY